MTKDGRKWVFNVYYKDLSGETQKFKSKKYLTNRAGFFRKAHHQTLKYKQLSQNAFRDSKIFT